MEQKTGVSSLYAEFFPDYGADIRLFYPAFRPNSTYKPTSTDQGGSRESTSLPDRLALDRTVSGRSDKASG